MKIYPFRAVMPNLSRIPTISDAFFDTVKEDYSNQKKINYFDAPTHESAFYLYQLTTSGRSFWGVLAVADMKEYLNGNIKKHENTIVVNEQKQSALLLERGAAIKPVLLAFKSPPQYPTDFFQQFCQNQVKNVPPSLSVNLSDTHHFWKISNPKDIETLEKYFEAIESAYIADGHHRCASSALLFKNAPTEANSKLFSAFFPVEELKINEFNRLLTGLNPAERAGLVAAIAEVCDIEPLEKATNPTEKFQFSVYINKKWHSATWKSEILEQFLSKNPNLVLLDVHLLNEKIFKEILNIKNIRRSERLRYVEGTRGLAKLQQLTDESGGVAFAMFPVVFDDLKMVSDTNGTMPPKSTFFEPRMKNGLVIYEI
ncbi:MAG: hypothetical protein RL757_475 [Bacteroidota bacterium]|jgi:uncharacterized protein (DUF1015 family)